MQFESLLHRKYLSIHAGSLPIVTSSCCFWKCWLTEAVGFSPSCLMSFSWASCEKLNYVRWLKVQWLKDLVIWCDSLGCLNYYCTMFAVLCCYTNSSVTIFGDKSNDGKVKCDCANIDGFKPWILSWVEGDKLAYICMMLLFLMKGIIMVQFVMVRGLWPGCAMLKTAHKC